jgi:hypothetical protein
VQLAHSRFRYNTRTYQAQGCADAVKISRVEEILVANSGEPSFRKGTIIWLSLCLCLPSLRSHVRLQISYLPEFDADKEALSVDLNHETGEFEFEYQETASPLYKRWRRKCPANEAFPVFNRFLQRKKWFSMRKS